MESVAVKMYISSLGGDWTKIYWFIMISAYVASQLANAGQTWFLGYWSADAFISHVTLFTHVYIGLNNITRRNRLMSGLASEYSLCTCV